MSPSSAIAPTQPDWRSRAALASPPRSSNITAFPSREAFDARARRRDRPARSGARPAGGFHARADASLRAPLLPDAWSTSILRCCRCSRVCARIARRWQLACASMAPRCTSSRTMSTQAGSSRRRSCRSCHPTTRKSLAARVLEQEHRLVAPRAAPGARRARALRRRPGRRARLRRTGPCAPLTMMRARKSRVPERHRVRRPPRTARGRRVRAARCRPPRATHGLRQASRSAATIRNGSPR